VHPPGPTEEPAPPDPLALALLTRQRSESRRHGPALALPVIVLLTILAVLRSGAGTSLDSLTPDEPWHIVAGVEYVRTSDFRLNPEHPPLVKLLAGAFMPAEFVLRPKAPLAEKAVERDLVEETFYRDNDFRAAQAAARRAMWTLNGFLLFGFGAVVWLTLGLPWAVGSVAFLGIDPTVAAHFPVVMTDLPLLLALGIAAVTLGRFVAGWEVRWALAAGLGMGLALGAKHSALPGLAALALVGAVALAVQPAAARERLRRLALLAGSGILAFGVLWALYGFQFHAGADGTDDFNLPMADKLADIRSDGWRGFIGTLDAWRLAPRPWLWGLADTVRVGVEGRGGASTLLWGEIIWGSPPWTTWPSFILVKLPLALLFVSGLGLVWMLVRLRADEPASPSARWVGFAVAAMAGGHLLALLSSEGTYGGVRHALPVYAAFALLAGAAMHGSLHRSPHGAGSRTLVGVAPQPGDGARPSVLPDPPHVARRSLPFLTGAGLLLALVTTLSEPRVWEYHNRLAGGTSGASLLFGNEGIDLGQRAFELADYYHEVVAPQGLPLYGNAYWIPRELVKALGLPDARRTTSLADDNVEGIYEGYFLYLKADQIPVPEWDYDPTPIFAGLERVAEFGVVEVWKGRQEVPKIWAGSMVARITDHVYREGGTDWELIAARGEQVLTINPLSLTAAIEAGNARLRLGDREGALRNFRHWFELEEAPPGLAPAVLESLRAMVTRLESGAPIAEIRPFRNPFFE
jgi:hypothetical protein